MHTGLRYLSPAKPPPHLAAADQQHTVASKAQTDAVMQQASAAGGKYSRETAYGKLGVRPTGETLIVSRNAQPVDLGA